MEIKPCQQVVTAKPSFKGTEELEETSVKPEVTETETPTAQNELERDTVEISGKEKDPEEAPEKTPTTKKVAEIAKEGAEKGGQLMGTIGKILATFLPI